MNSTILFAPDQPPAPVAKPARAARNAAFAAPVSAAAKAPAEAPPAPPPREPDLVDRIFEFLADDRRLAVLDAQALAALKTAVREEFKGEECYIAGRPASARQELAASVLALFNGRNAREVARALRIGRATVYRVLKQSGRR